MADIMDKDVIKNVHYTLYTLDRCSFHYRF
ncbi:MAG: hypothetical protein ACI9RZ_002425 [Sphingobacteriales bacterium]|jgi:hypothetical protein